MSGSITVFDEETGEIDFAYQTRDIDQYQPPVVTYVLDYDQREEFPWLAYEVSWHINLWQVLLKSVAVTWDDGGTTIHEVGFRFSPGGTAVPFTNTYTERDGQGRTESVVVYFDNPRSSDYWGSSVNYSQTEYDVDTGNLNYTYVIHRSGLVEAKDFNADTGLIDYAYTEFTDGRTLAQDYDALGRLDYEVDRLADGRMVVTDYDLLDQHTWASYSIAYAASGAIESVTVL